MNNFFQLKFDKKQATSTSGLEIKSRIKIKEQCETKNIGFHLLLDYAYYLSILIISKCSCICVSVCLSVCVSVCIF